MTTWEQARCLAYMTLGAACAAATGLFGYGAGALACCAFLFGTNFGRLLERGGKDG